MGTIIINNRTTFVRCPKNAEHPFTRVPAKLFSLNGYQLAIMVHILSNKDGWNLVKYEIGKRLGFPRNKFNGAWKSLEDLGYIKKTRIQGGWNYTIIEDLDFTPTTGGNCEESTLTTGAQCKDGQLTTIKNNYNYFIATNDKDSNCYEKQFNELIELYPVSSTWNNGRTVALNSNLPECKKLYTEFLSTGKELHQEIIACLKVELAEREKTGNKQYQPSLLKWIKEAGWKVYKSRTLQPVYAPYGTELE
jgi:hypothetical protein